jgi:hypothetical protein
MKKIYILFTFLFMFSIASIFPQTLLENFDYPVGDTLTSHGWSTTGTTTTNPVLVVSPGLSYPGYSASGIGNAASLTTSGQDVNKKYTDSVTSGSVYASFLVNVTSAQAAGDYFIHLGVNPTNTFDFFARTFVKLAANGNLTFGISKTSVNASNPVIYSDSIYTTGTTYLLVVKYTLNAGATNDTVNLFINPVISGVEPSPTLTVATTQTDAISLWTVNLRQGNAANAANVIIDGIKVSTTWSDIVPVELVSFNAYVNGLAVNLSWTTATEINNSGFEVERKLASSSNWQKIGFVSGNGSTTEIKRYSFIDQNLNEGKYSYRLKQVDYNGEFEYSNSIEVDVLQLDKFELNQNYPNPFNPNTSIKFSLPFAGNVKLSVYNLLGQEIQTLINGFKDAGIHTVNFEAKNLNSGIYLYKLEANGLTQTRKMTLLK